MTNVIRLWRTSSLERKCDARATAQAFVGETPSLLQLALVFFKQASRRCFSQFYYILFESFHLYVHVFNFLQSVPSNHLTQRYHVDFQHISMKQSLYHN